MSQMNKSRPASPAPLTHGGAPAVRNPTPEAALRRTMMTALLWESSFYEDGASVADRIKKLVPQIDGEVLMNMAVEARQEFYLRHVPLLVTREMARHRNKRQAEFVRETLGYVIRRPDELSEFLSIYWADNTHTKKRTLANSVKRGLADAYKKFELFQLSKYDNREKEVRLRDVMFMTHPKPKDATRRWTAAERRADKARKQRAWAFAPQEAAFYATAQDELKHEGTWEARMSDGEAPKQVFEDLMAKGELGALAFIRNIRKMDQAGVDRYVMKQYASTMNVRGVLPHQILTSARVNPAYENILEMLFFSQTAKMDKLPGKTVLLIDVSGSMDGTLSKGGGKYKKGMTYAEQAAQQAAQPTRLDAACAVAMMARELCEDVVIYTFASSGVVSVPPRRGFALRDAIVNSQSHGGTDLPGAIFEAMAQKATAGYTRMLVITDEQSTHHGRYTKPHGPFNYIMNVASYEYGVGNAEYWTTISGWSPQVLRYVHLTEKQATEKEVDVLA